MAKKAMKLTKSRRACLELIARTELFESDFDRQDVLDYALQYLALTALKKTGHLQLTMQEARTIFTQDDLFYELIDDDFIHVPTPKLCKHYMMFDSVSPAEPMLEPLRIEYEQPTLQRAVESCTNCHMAYNGLHCPNCDQ